MAVTRQKKEEVLAQLIQMFKESKSVVFAQYRGLSVKDVTQLRGDLREKGVDYKVAKRTLLKLAAKEAGVGELSDEVIDGPVGAAFSYEDEVAAAKILFELGKKMEGLKLQGGVMDGEVFGHEKAVQLAQIPGKDELIGKFMGSLQSPVYGLHGVMNGVLRSFVGTLQAVVDQGGVGEETAQEEAPAEEAAAPEAEEASTEEAPKEEAAQDEKTEEVAEAPAEETTEDAPTEEEEAPAEEAAAEEESEEKSE